MRSRTAAAGRGLGTARHAYDKFRWGARTAGTARAGVGVVRLLRIRAGRSRHGEVRLRSGAVLGFEVPGQVPAALVMFGDLIDPEFRFLAEVAQADWIVVDVGAAIGQFSVFAGRLPVAVVHAYEPSGANLASLTSNVSRNGLDERVEVHAVALSDHAGLATFETAPNAYLSRLDLHPAESPEQVVVPVRTLAEEMARLGIAHVSVLKVNVAGYEPEVLAGAAPLLRAGSVGILVLLIGTRSIPWYVECETWGYEFFFYHPEDRALHRITTLDESSLLRPPWPARHVIGIHRDVVRSGAWDALTTR